MTQNELSGRQMRGARTHEAAIAEGAAARRGPFELELGKLEVALDLEEGVEGV